jgi:ankyrin repeat protein
MRTVLEPSCARGSLEKMARAPGNPNLQGPFGNTLLHSAVASGNLREVRKLLAAGADPRIANREGRTALHVAVILGHDDIHRLLDVRREEHLEQLLDQALADTFPASDPVALVIPA